MKEDNILICSCRKLGLVAHQVPSLYSSKPSKYLPCSLEVSQQLVEERSRTPWLPVPAPPPGGRLCRDTNHLKYL